MRYRISGKECGHGFTLIELMITVAVVAILAAIAYPSYQSQIRKSRRSEAKSALLQIQVAQEKQFLKTNSYGNIASLDAAALGLKTVGANYFTSNGYYQVSFDSQTATAYVARAAKAGSQASDSCGDYTISSTGAKEPTTAGCW